MNLISNLNGKEAPMDLSKVKIPFQNTSDFLLDFPDSNYHLEEYKN